MPLRFWHVPLLALAQQEPSRLADVLGFLHNLADALPHGVADEAEAAFQDDGILFLGRDPPPLHLHQEVVVVAWPAVGGRIQLADTLQPVGVVVSLPFLHRRRRPAVALRGAPVVGGTLGEGFLFALLCFALLCFALLCFALWRLRRNFGRLRYIFGCLRYISGRLGCVVRFLVVTGGGCFRVGFHQSVAFVQVALAAAFAAVEVLLLDVGRGQDAVFAAEALVEKAAFDGRPQDVLHLPGVGVEQLGGEVLAEGVVEADVVALAAVDGGQGAEQHGEGAVAMLFHQAAHGTLMHEVGVQGEVVQPLFLDSCHGCRVVWVYKSGGQGSGLVVQAFLP